MKYRKINKSLWKAIQNDYEINHIPLKILSEKYSIKPGTLRAHKLRHGWKILNGSKHILAFNDYKQGMRYVDIAQKYNVSLSTVKSWKQRYWENFDRNNRTHRKIKIKHFGHAKYIVINNHNNNYELLIENILFKSHISNHIKDKCISFVDDLFMQRDRFSHLTQCASSGEYMVKKFLDSHNIKYIQQATFDKCVYKKKLPFDFYLPSLKTCIEYDGKQHYIPVEYFGGSKTFKLVNKRDYIKNKFCRQYHIRLIRIPFYANVNQMLNLRLMGK